MSYLDLRSFNLMSGLMTTVLGIVLLGVRRQLPRNIHGLLLWGLAPLVCAGATLFYGLEGMAPAAVVSIGGNGLLLAGCILYYAGSQRFYDVLPSWRGWSVLALACVATMQFFLLVVPDYRLRMACFAFSMAAIIAAHVRLLLRHGEEGFAPRFTAVMLAIQGLVLVMRGIATFWIDAPDTNRFTVVSPVHAFYIGTFSFGALLVSIGVQFMAGERIHKEFEHLANHDSLTGARSRRALMEAAAHELQRARRYGQPLALLMMDIDHFKSINDQHGHLAGDRVLVQFAQTVRSTLRNSDLLGRYGGEEFMVLLPATEAEAALAAAERMRQAVAAQPSAEGRPACTVSIGMAKATPNDTQVEALITRADAALYRAKAAGRNRVEFG
ncbi:MAG: GGDEF domain-containing protein [Burkholderiaceae bacterium]|nr:GGDEF domain-containing protein [Burkholderiaceae bacterium]